MHLLPLLGYSHLLPENSSICLNLVSVLIGVHHHRWLLGGLPFQEVCLATLGSLAFVKVGILELASAKLLLVQLLLLQ